MEVLLANEYGFCFGVERAVEMVEDALQVGAPVRTLGPLIHNTQEMQRLECEGVSTVQDPAEVSADEIAVIRAQVNEFELGQVGSPSIGRNGPAAMTAESTAPGSCRT